MKQTLKSFHFIRNSSYAVVFSVLITLASIVLLFTQGLNLGIDFTGGIMLEVRSQQEIDLDNLRHVLAKAGYTGNNVQNMLNSNDIIIRVQPKNKEGQSFEADTLKQYLQNNIASDLDFRSTSYIGPKAGKGLVTDALKATIAALVFMLLYIWLRFDWQFGLGAVAALIHDIISVMGFFALTQFEFDLSAVAALLTIIGYSINDSVVIYDRIRENLRKYKSRTLEFILNNSIHETLSRTIMTSLTTLVVCVVLVIWGGSVLRAFSAALCFGIVFGTYSSIFISTPILSYTHFQIKT